jgi:hypothetical protein
MTNFEALLRPFMGKLVQEHHTADKLAAQVADEATKRDLAAACEAAGIRAHVTVKPVTASDPRTVQESTSDRVETVWTGVIDVRLMRPTGFGKIHNAHFIDRFVEVFRESSVFEPVVLRSNYDVIDGEVRVLAAQRLRIERLPAIVLNATELQAKFLRLVLNKSAEFQRWHWDEVDAFLDEHPEYFPVLEPLGIFGERKHPKSFLANSVVGYEVHDQAEGRTQQAAYRQEPALAEWAKIERAKRAVEEEVRKARRTSK